MTDIDLCTTVILDGGLVLLPTDTVWGISCDPFNENSVKKVFDLKSGRVGDGLVLLVSDYKMLNKYIPNIHPRIDLVLKYHNRPLTILYPKPHHLPTYLEGKGGLVAIRICKDPFINELISRIDKPIVSTSANEIQEPIPGNFGQINSNILQGVNYVARYRYDEKEKFMPSQVAFLNEKTEELEFLRE